MRTRAVRWVITDDGGGLHGVDRDGRQVLSDVPFARAESYIRSRIGTGDTVRRRAEDGYLTVHSLPSARKR